jgi:hypothetical protein
MSLLKNADVWTLLELIVAEFSSTSVHNFDQRLIDRANELVRTHRESEVLREQGLAEPTRLKEYVRLIEGCYELRETGKLCAGCVTNLRDAVNAMEELGKMRADRVRATRPDGAPTK